MLTKSLGSANPHNVVRATFNGLECLKEPAAVARLRGKNLEEMVAKIVMAKKEAKKSAEAKRVKVTLVKSTIGFDRKQAAIVGAWVCAGSTTPWSWPTRRRSRHDSKVRHLVEVQ